MELLLAVLLAASVVALAATYSALRTERARAHRAGDRLPAPRLDPAPPTLEPESPARLGERSEASAPGPLPPRETPPAPAVAASAERLTAALVGPAERLSASVEASGPALAAAIERLRNPLPPPAPDAAAEEAAVPEFSPESLERAIVAAERISDERARLADDVRSLRASLERVAALDAGLGRAAAELSRSVDAFLPLASSISGLADRANLLGLNVSLLAARAGDAGAPFEEAAAELRGLFEEARRLSRELSEAGRKTETGTRRVTVVVEESSEAAVAGSERGGRAVERLGTLEGHCGQAERALGESIREVRAAADGTGDLVCRLEAARAALAARSEEAARLRAEAEADRAALRAAVERLEALRLDGAALGSAVARLTSGA